MEDVSIDSVNLGFFFKENQIFVVHSYLTFHGITNLIENQLTMGGPFRVGFGGGIDHTDIGIQDRVAFEKEIEPDEFHRAFQLIAFVTAVSPLATKAMVRKLYQRLSLNNKILTDEYFHSTPQQSMGKDLVTVITLARVWAAVARNEALEILDLQDVSFVDFWEVATSRVESELTGFNEMRTGISEILDQDAGSSWGSLSVQEARENFEKMVVKASEFDIYNFIKYHNVLKE